MHPEELEVSAPPGPAIGSPSSESVHKELREQPSKRLLSTLHITAQIRNIVDGLRSVISPLKRTRQPVRAARHRVIIQPSTTHDPTRGSARMKTHRRPRATLCAHRPVNIQSIRFATGKTEPALLRSIASRSTELGTALTGLEEDFESESMKFHLQWVVLTWFTLKNSRKHHVGRMSDRAESATYLRSCVIEHLHSGESAAVG